MTCKPVSSEAIAWVMLLSEEQFLVVCQAITYLVRLKVMCPLCAMNHVYENWQDVTNFLEEVNNRCMNISVH